MAELLELLDSVQTPSQVCGLLSRVLATPQGAIDGATADALNLW